MASVHGVGTCPACGGRVVTDGSTLWCTGCENDCFPGIAIPDDMKQED